MSNRVLRRINSPEDIKALKQHDLKTLVEELREMLISNISNNGGHLASNLGVVELTVALLDSFDFKNDKIVWDVGHQSYVYKILTGRRDLFSTIRKKEGLSGFPKRSESSYDYFDTGHSSTSVSAALGYARAAKLRGKDEYSVAVIGDGALTGGIALEALNDAGASGQNLIVVLNDNEMSISKNVGGFAEYFSRMRSSRLYSGTNDSVKKGVERIPFIGKFISRTIHRSKSAVKYLFSQNMLFEEMGFHYLGPVDGHDLKRLKKIFNDAKKIKGPVLVHAVTTKGKGYKKAENEPMTYHGVGKFDALNGIEIKEDETFSSILGKNLTELTKKDSEVVVICPAVTPGCGLVELAKAIPERYFDVGIAEQHAVTMAAGMACGGLRPIVSGYSTFMQRAYDQILHDVCLMNLHVVFTFDRAGVVGKDGPTHQGVYDLAYLSSMPNIKIYAPSDKNDLLDLLKLAIYDEDCPVVIRYPKGDIKLPIKKKEFIPGKAQLIQKGNDIAILAYGKMLEDAFRISEIIKEYDLSCSVIDISSLKPLDKDGIAALINKNKIAVFIEDVIESGSCYQRMHEFISNESPELKILGFNLGNEFTAEGSREEILTEAGLSDKEISKAILKILEYIT